MQPYLYCQLNTHTGNFQLRTAVGDSVLAVLEPDSIMTTGPAVPTGNVSVEYGKKLRYMKQSVAMEIKGRSLATYLHFREDSKLAEALGALPMRVPARYSKSLRTYLGLTPGCVIRYYDPVLTQV